MATRRPPRATASRPSPTISGSCPAARSPRQAVILILAGAAPIDTDWWQGELIGVGRIFRDAASSWPLVRWSDQKLRKRVKLSGRIGWRIVTLLILGGLFRKKILSAGRRDKVCKTI